ncbi:MAG: ABC transporter substrate-binding protein [Cellvibrionaceae bacterium]|nr:ABC transporter substrate-binding protein [Motiliproteus sp.]MCW9052163.1 ABC transporter substrate-binding protein [Motiliproteus sp.]
MSNIANKANRILVVLSIFLFSLLTHAAPDDIDRPLKIAMILWRGETEAERGFKDALTSLGYKAEFYVFNGNQNREKLAETLRTNADIINKDFDYLYSFGTTATQMLNSVSDESTPHIFNIVTNPVSEGFIKTMQKPEVNRTGTSQRIPVSRQLEPILQIKNINKLAFFFNPRERNSELIRKELYGFSNRQGIEILEFRCAPGTNRLERYLDSITNTKDPIADAAYFPGDSYLVSKAELIGQKIQKAGLIAIGAHQDYARYGVLAAVMPDYYRLGEAAATQLHRHYHGGILNDIPVYSITTEYNLIVNRKTQDLLGIDISKSTHKNVVFID